MRANSLALRYTLSKCAANFGEYSPSNLSIASLVLAEDKLKKTVVARPKSWPAFSIAIIVLSKLGTAGLLAMASISLLLSAMPRSNAGAKSLSLILSNCGYW